MRAHPSPVRAAVTLLAVAAAILLWAPRVAALETLIQADQNYQNHHATHLPAPAGLTEPLRLNELPASCSGLQTDGSRAATCVTPLSIADPFDIVSNTLTLKFDGTLHIVGGQLSVNGTGGLIADAPLTFSGLHLQLTVDGTSLGLSGSTLQRQALVFSGAVTGTMAAGSGSLTTAFGEGTATSLLGVTGSSAARADIQATADNQVYQRLGGAVVAHTLDFSQLTGTPPAITSVTGAVVGSGPGVTATTFGAAGPRTVLANGTAGSTAPTFIGPASAAQVFMADPSTSALGWEIPPLVTLSTPGYMSAADKLKINGGVTPTVTTDLLRYGDLQGCVGVIQWTGSALGCAADLTVADPFAIVSNVLTLKLDSTLHLVGGQLSVVSAPPTGSATGDLGGSYPGPTVLAAEFGAQRLTFGTAADGSLLKRSGTTVVGATSGTDFAVTVRADGISTGTVQLASVAAANLVGGAVAWVDSVGDYFKLVQSALATTATTVVTASGKSGYQWVRLNAMNSNWAAKTAWFVDPQNSSAAASDENSGASSGAPLLTWYELSRRLWNVSLVSGQFVTITVMSDGNSTDAVVMNVHIPGNSNTGVFIIGSLTPMYSGTISTYTAGAAGPAADDYEITDSTLPTSFSASGLLADGLLARTTSGNVRNFYFAKDLGSKTARISVPVNNNGGGAAVLTPGQTYSVYALKKIYGLQWPALTDKSVTNAGIYLTYEFINDASPAYRWQDASFIHTWRTSDTDTDVSFNTTNVSIGTGLVANFRTGRQSSIFNNGVVRSNVLEESGAEIYTGVIFQGTALQVQRGASAVFIGRSSCYDNNTNCLLVSTGAQAIFQGTTSNLSGSGNTNGLISVGGGGRVFYDATPVVAGSSSSGSPIGINTVAFPVSALPISDPNSGAGIRLTGSPVLGPGVVKWSSSGVLANAADGTDFLSPSTGLLRPGSNGILAWTGSTVASRTLTNGDGTISGTNLDGVSGNPEIHVNAIPESKVTSLVTDLAGKQATGNYLTGLSSAVTATGPGTVTATVHLDAGSTVQGLLPLGNLVNCATGQIVGMVGGVEGCVTPAVGTVYTGVSPIVVNSGTGQISCPTCGTGTGSGTVTTVTGTAPVVITSTPTTTPNVTIQGALLDGTTGTSGQNLGGLTSGTLQQTVSAGHSTISAFNGTAGSVPFYTSSGQFAQDNSGFFYDGTNHRLGLGNTAPSYPLDITQTVNGPTGARTTNLSTGSSAYSQFLASNDAGELGYFGVAGTNYSGFSPFNGGSAYFGSYSTQASIFTQTANPIVFYTNANPVGQFTAAGALRVGNLSAGGLTKAAASTGELGIASASDVAAAITWPVSPRVLISGGISATPVGDSNFTFDTSTHTLTSAGANSLSQTTLLGTTTFASLAGAALPLGMDILGHPLAISIGDGLKYAANTLSAYRADSMHFYVANFNGITTNAWLVPAGASSTGIDQQAGADPPETRFDFIPAHVRILVHNIGVPPAGCNTGFAISETGNPLVSSVVTVTSSTPANTYQDSGLVSVSAAGTDSWGVQLSSAPSNASGCTWRVYVTAYFYQE